MLLPLPPPPPPTAASRRCRRLRPRRPREASRGRLPASRARPPLPPRRPREASRARPCPPAAAGRPGQRLLPRVAPASAAAAAYISSAAAAVHGGAVPASASASVFPDTLDRGSEAYAHNAVAVAGLLSDLRARVSQVPPRPLPSPLSPALI
nr:unnamed protein product [Digitaria exilis]